MSNAGQVLRSGIAIDDHAPAVAARLLEQDLFGGWGVRTLSSEAVDSTRSDITSVRSGRMTTA